MTPVRREGGEVFVAAASMEAIAAATFRKVGCSEAESRRIATRLTGANLRGHDSHGVIRIPRYYEWLRDGIQLADQTVEVLQENEVLAVVDGKFGMGQTVGEQAVDIGIAKAGKHGIAITALRNAGHLGRIGDWAERAAAAGLVSIHMVNVRGSLIVAPYGGIDRRMSTSPFCAGIPLPGEEPIILDMATSMVAEGKALVALKGGKPLPEGAVIDADGSVTNDPRPLYGDVQQGETPSPAKGPGALTTFGLHKGSGLNFLMEMMAGALTGSGVCAVLDEAEKRRFCNGMFSIYMSPATFGHADDSFSREVKAYVAFVKSSRPSTPGGKVLVPGEKERMTRADRMKSGLPLAPEAWDDIVATARNAGLKQGEIEELIGGKP
jgi:hydroxycarboxylate dehydrogenase B